MQNIPTRPSLPARWIQSLLLTLALLLPVACVGAPTSAYPYTAPIVAERNKLSKALLTLLPTEQQTLPEAQAEASWLADTAYKAAAGIARVNQPALAGWLNNRLVNSSFHFKERGLCWHYQHDMYRELRRHSLHFFRIGCCVRDRATKNEHNCIYLCPTGDPRFHGIILDAWRYHGRLKVMSEKEFAVDAWEDSPDSCRFLSVVYPEQHHYPIEHWAKVRSDHSWKEYVPCWTPEGTSCRQGILMQYNMYHGLQSRKGKLTNY